MVIKKISYRNGVISSHSKPNVINLGNSGLRVSVKKKEKRKFTVSVLKQAELCPTVDVGFLYEFHHNIHRECDLGVSKSMVVTVFGIKYSV